MPVDEPSRAAAPNTKRESERDRERRRRRRLIPLNSSSSLRRRRRCCKRKYAWSRSSRASERLRAACLCEEVSATVDCDVRSVRHSDAPLAALARRPVCARMRAANQNRAVAKDVSIISTMDAASHPNHHLSLSFSLAQHKEEAHT